MASKRQELIKNDLKFRWLSFRRWRQQHGSRIDELRIVPWILAVAAMIIVFIPMVRDWADRHQGAITAAAGLAATSFAWFTLEIVRQGREGLYVAKEQAANQFAPLLALELVPGGTISKFELKVTNVGNGVALNTHFVLLPPNVAVDGMSEPARTLPLVFEMQPGGNAPINVLALGRSFVIKFTASEGYAGHDMWEKFESHPLVRTQWQVYLGILEITYGRIDDVEMKSSCTFEWNKSDNKVQTWGMNVSSPMIRPPRMPVVNTRAWYRFPHR